jgi:hypothetical protein
MVKTYTIESTDHRAHMSEHEDGRWMSKADYDALAAELAAEKSRLPALGEGYEALWLRAKKAEDRIHKLEAGLRELVAEDWRNVSEWDARARARALLAGMGPLLTGMETKGEQT